MKSLLRSVVALTLGLTPAYAQTSYNVTGGLTVSPGSPTGVLTSTGTLTLTPVVTTPPPPASVSVSTGAASTNLNTATTPAINDVGANLILVAVSGAANPIPETALSDSAGNSWTGTTVVNGTDGAGRATTIFAKFSPTVTASQTFAVNAPGAGPTISVLAVNGATQINFVKQSGSAGASVNSIAPGNGTPSSSNELIFSSLLFTSSSATGIAVNSGFTLTNTFPGVAGQSYAGGSAYQIQTTATAVNPTWSWTSPAAPAATAMVGVVGTFSAPTIITGSNGGGGTGGTGGGFANACATGVSPTFSLNQASLTTGTPVNVTLSCLPATGANLNWKIWGWGEYANQVPLVSGQATYAMSAPSFALHTKLPGVSVFVTDANGTELANSDANPVPMLPNITRTLAAALPSDEPDPFVPAHTVTVCPTGCQYAHPEDAIIFVMGQTTWDNVLITVDAAEYYTTASAADSNYMFFNNPNMPNHIWVKGIVGASGTDGTVFPHIWGGNVQTGSSILTLDGSLTGKTVTIDNFDIGPIISGQLISDIGGTLNLRNVYAHDAYYLLISNDNINATTNIYNSHFSRGHSHDIYIGAEGGNGSLTIKNSVVEQANAGHDVKSRATVTELDCNEIIIDQDPVYMGSELTDCSEGRECHVHNSVYVTAEGAGDSWVDNQGFDSLRYGADREFPTLANNILDFSGNTVVVDAGGSGHRMLNVYRPMSPTPPYPISGNTLVYHSATQAGKNPGGPVYFGGHDDEISAPIAIVNDIGSGTTATELTYVNGTVFNDRASAGLPAARPAGAVVAFNDPSIPSRPAACTDPLGNVKIPAH